MDEVARRTYAPGATAGATCDSCFCSARDCFSSLLVSFPIVLGLIIGGATAVGPITIGGVTFDVDTMVAAGGLVSIGFQSILLWLFTRVYANAEGFLPESQKAERVLAWLSLERILILGGVIGLAGLLGLIFSLTSWQANGFGHLNYEHALRLMVPSATALVLSFQAIFGCFFLSILDIKQTRRTSNDTHVSLDPKDDREIATAHSL
jgi:hypothetical protein